MAEKRNNSPKGPASNVAKGQLARYRSICDFDVTPEPKGRGSGKQNTNDAHKLPFVIQKHAATRLHYDFRLGWSAVLKSWAVTKGSSYFPGDKRLAVQVEDHPLDYGGFEGIIPKGQYGAGTVMLWDRGTWGPHGDVAEGLKKGNLKFALHGENKLSRRVTRREFDR
jgi:bifunctional non-homologous end joining protein LigD